MPTNMFSWGLQRLTSALVTLWLAFTLVFFLLRVIPGDAIATELLQTGAGQEAIEQQRALMGLDQPVLQQYGAALSGYLVGDFGVSLLTRRPVSEMLLDRLDSTAELTMSSWLIAVGLGVVFGYFAGLRRGIAARLAQFMVGLALSVPLYWTATLILFVFAVRSLDVLLLPALILGYHTSGGIARILQANVASVMSAGFVQAAHAKGLKHQSVLVGHVLRVALLSVIAVSALQAGFIFSGAVITESIFNRAGIGTLLLRAVVEQDYPVVQGVVLLSAFVYVVMNLLADGLQYLADPRLRLS